MMSERRDRSSAAPMHRSMSSYEIISRCRILLAALAVVVCAAPARAAEVTVVEPGGPTVVRDDPALPAASDLAVEGVRAPRDCQAAPIAAAAKGGPTVLGTLARLERAGVLSAADHARYETDYR